MRKILALDQASVTTGWSVFKENKLVEYGHFSFDSGTDLGVRLNKIRDKVAQLIMDYDIDYVIFEDIQQQENPQTFKTLAEVFGVIYELVTDLGIEHTAVLASVWKSKIGIKGKNRPQQKQNAVNFVTETYNIKPTSDEADSICIGVYCMRELDSKIDFE